MTRRLDHGAAETCICELEGQIIFRERGRQAGITALSDRIIDFHAISLYLDLHIYLNPFMAVWRYLEVFDGSPVLRNVDQSVWHEPRQFSVAMTHSVKERRNNLTESKKLRANLTMDVILKRIFPSITPDAVERWNV